MPETLSIALTVLKFLFDMAIQPSSGIEPEWFTGQGQYVISADVSENEACSKAEKRAKLDAVRKLGGERLSSETVLACAENPKGVECPITQFTWSMFDGLIKDIKDKKVEKVTEPNGATVCTVSLQAYVDAGVGKPDPNFDLTVRLPRKVFENRDRMKITLNTTSKMYVNIFNWNPYDKTDEQVKRIFPNQLDKNNLIEASATIPTNQRYSIRVQYPDTKGDAFEYLHVIATRQSVKFLDTYSLHEFRNKVLEIPRRHRRYVRKPYRIVR